MNKELDYVDDILKNEPMTLNKRMIIESIKEKIQRLESIDNAKPSEALEVLEIAKKVLTKMFGEKVLIESGVNFDTIEQVLLKAHELEKVLSIIKEKTDFVFFGRTKEIKLEQVDGEGSIHLMNETGDTLLPDEEYDLLKRWLG